VNIKNVAILGAGNGGQAIAGSLAIKGFNVRLWDRSYNRIEPIRIKGGISLTGEIIAFGEIKIVSNNLSEVIQGAEVIMVVTTADAHGELAIACAPFLESGQIIILNPGRTFGAVEFRKRIYEYGYKGKVYIAEAQSLIYACRITDPASVNIIGIKKTVPLSAFPASDTSYVIDIAKNIYSSYVYANNILETGLENIGAIFHPTIALFNAVRIEAGDEFLFYQSLTPKVSLFLEKIDKERIDIGVAFGMSLTPVKDWISRSYSGVKGSTLYARIRSNPAYNGIVSPKNLDTRLIYEDIPTGLVPMIELGRISGIETPLIHSIVKIWSGLCKRDFYTEGRNLKNLGLDKYSKQELIDLITKS